VWLLRLYLIESQSVSHHSKCKSTSASLDSEACQKRDSIVSHEVCSECVSQNITTASTAADEVDSVCVTHNVTTVSDNIIIIDNINNPSEFSSSKHILHEVNLFCSEVRVEFAYSLAKGE